jgi:ribonuclease VapC
MVIDSSAVLAILFGEPVAKPLATAMNADATRLVSAPGLLECSIVLVARYGDAALRELDLLVHRAALDIVPFDGEHYEIARNAFRRFGKGRHRAGLNYGDCMTYALAASTAEPVLFVGEDFARTDLPAVPWQ